MSNIILALYVSQTRDIHSKAKCNVGTYLEVNHKNDQLG